MEPLVMAVDLAEFPGAPFSQAVIDSAAARIRREAGWHIAPVVTETITLDSYGGRVLLLPTLHLVSVTQVRDMTGASPRVMTGWRMSQAGMLSAGSWPVGFSAIEVDMVHGYETCPPELFPLLTEWAHRKVRQESQGGRSVTFDVETGPAAGVLERFRLGPRS